MFILFIEHLLFFIHQRTMAKFTVECMSGGILTIIKKTTFLQYPTALTKMSSDTNRNDNFVNLVNNYL